MKVLMTVLSSRALRALENPDFPVDLRILSFRKNVPDKKRQADPRGRFRTSGKGNRGIFSG